MKQQRNGMIGWPGRLLAALVLVNLLALGSGCGKKPALTPEANENDGKQAKNDQGAKPGAGSAAALIPASAIGFVHVDVSALWNSAQGKEARKLFDIVPQQQSEMARESTGIPFEQVKTFAFVVLEFKGEPLRVVTASKDLDATELSPTLLPRWGAEMKTIEYKGKSILIRPYLTFNDVGRRIGPAVKEKSSPKGKEKQGPRGKPELSPDRSKGVCFLSARHFTMGSLKQIKQYIDWSEQKPSAGPMSAALAQAGKHQVFVALDLSQLPAPLTEEVPAGFRPLLEAKLGTVALDYGSTSKLNVRLDFADDAKAKAGLRSADDGLNLVKGLLVLARGTVEKEKTLNAMVGDAYKEVEEAIRSAKVKQDGSSIELALAAKLPLKVDAAALTHMRDSANRTKSANNLKQFGLAFHNWASVYQDRLPPAAVCDKNGKPLLSWRVLILPFIEQDALYKQFKFDEPWDSPHNKKLMAQMPEIYKSPGAKDDGKHLTHYRLFVGPGTIYPGKPGAAHGVPTKDQRGIVAPFTIGGIPDGSSNTIMIVEAAEGVPWTKPEPLLYDAKKPLPKMYDRNGSFLVAWWDGSVRTINIKAPEKSLRPAITPADGMVLPDDLFDR